jgi:hypothetical protein
MAMPAVVAPPPDDKPKLDALLNILEKERGRPAIVYWTGPFARVSLAAEMSLFDQLTALGGHKPAIDLVLSTNGGDTEAPCRVVHLIREFCDKFAVLVPHRASSAGTHVAMGADEIVMTPLSVLGPTDPSRSHPLLPRREGAKEAEPISVQDMRHAMQFIRESAPSGVAYTPEALAQIFSSLFEKIHPLAIGAIEQSYALAKLVGRMCLETHMNAVTDKAQIDAIVNRLCDDYKSHSFPISRREAKAIGLKVVDAEPKVEAILLDLLKFYTGRPIDPFTNAQPKPGQQLKMQIAWIDSVRAKFRVVQDARIGPKGEIESLGDQWLTY